MEEKLRAWLKKAEKLPVIGSAAEELLTMSRLLGDFSRGSYRSIPRGTILAAAIALGYALSPIDLILDVIPLAGLLDDAAVIGLILEFGLSRDLSQYRRWRGRLQDQQWEAHRVQWVAQCLELLGSDVLAAPFLTEQRQLKLLICAPEERSQPLRCRAVTVPIGEEQLKELELTEWEELGEFFTTVFEDTAIPWSTLGRQPFRPEYSCGPLEEFEIVD